MGSVVLTASRNMLTRVTWILVLLWKSEQIVPHSDIKQPDLTALDLQESHVDLQTAKVSFENMTLIIKSTDDQLMTAKLVKEDDCIFTGYMVGCPESTVVVTGCPGEARSVQIQSHMFGDMAFTTEDGVVKSVVLNTKLKRNKRNTGCVCNGWLDTFGHDNCKQDNWCYVDEDTGCENMDAYYGGKWKSTTPCSNSSPPTDLLYLASTMIVELPSFTPFTSCPVDSYPGTVSWAVTAVLDNRLKVCGGYDDADDSQSACYSLTESTYRQTGGRWLPEPGMLEKRAYAASSYWPGHGLLVTGGRNGYVTLSSTEYLSTSSAHGQWTPGPDLPEGIAGHCQVTAGPDVIITGGFVGNSMLDSAYKLSTDGSSWIQLPSLATARYAHACVVHQDYLYVMGGYGGYSIRVEKMKLTSLTKWEAGPGLDTAFQHGQAIVYQDTIFLVYEEGKVVKLNTEDKWEVVTDLGRSIGSRPVFPAPVVTPGAIGC